MRPAYLTAACLAALVLAVIPAAGAQEEFPGWVRTIAKFWSEGGISDSEFVRAIEYLINNGFITLHSTIPGPIMESDVSMPAGSEPIPLPYKIDSDLIMSERSGTCSMTIDGLRIDRDSNNRYSLEATMTSNIPGDTCRLLTHLDRLEEGADTALAAVLLHHSNHAELTTLYRLWEPHSDDLGTWTFSTIPARSDGLIREYDSSWDDIESIELLFYEIRYVTVDHAETTFFGNANRHSEYLEPLILQ
ncbi:MAG: hypothetical protein EB829_00975 [Nitrosopumilus sp. H8]|nr:MAG: hypothetical protein EB830_04295 [Nitrosopumilus sp. H13]RNJ79966.1 MAG: hypothetical protein EB829_00975 [Nitrosopumilus sp. H8]